MMPLVSLFFLSSCSKDEDEQVEQPKTIVEATSGDARFSILVEAIVKADLASALSGNGPFTVFAPTNEAFNELFAQLGVSGISYLTAEQLTTILLYHVVAANVVASQVASGSVPTLKDGSSLNVTVNNMGVTLNSDVKVIATDVQGTNGVIHAIDAVLLPE